MSRRRWSGVQEHSSWGCVHCQSPSKLDEQDEVNHSKMLRESTLMRFVALMLRISSVLFFVPFILGGQKPCDFLDGLRVVTGASSGIGETTV